MKYLGALTLCLVCFAAAQVYFATAQVRFAAAQVCLLPEGQQNEAAYGPYDSVTYTLTAQDVLGVTATCDGLVFSDVRFDRVGLSWSGYPAQALAYRLRRGKDWSAWRVVKLTFSEDGLRNGVIGLEDTADALELLPQDPQLLFDLRVELISSDEVAFDPSGHQLFLRHDASGWAVWQFSKDLEQRTVLSDKPDDLYYNLVVSPDKAVIALLKVDARDSCMPCAPSAVVLDAETGAVLAQQQLATAEGVLVWYDRLVYEQSRGASGSELVDIVY